MATPAILNDRYQLQQSLGTGGMALVYKARDLMLERPVAVKLLREDFSQDVAFRERFRQEARAAANLSHPNIVTVHDFGLDQGHLFIVMEYVPGTDLKSLIKEKRKFTVAEALQLMVQACQGVGYAHRAGLVHCDIKPHNFLVSPEARLKVTDFGIARALSTISPEEHHDVVWGSPHYFSPEQAAGLPPSPASDVYSLGVILYEMLTGKLPFEASNSTELARMHREETPVAPRSIDPAIPAQIEEIMLKVLSKEPSARYRTADQLGRLLQAFQENGGINPSPIGYTAGMMMGSTSFTSAATVPPPAVDNPTITGPGSQPVGTSAAKALEPEPGGKPQTAGQVVTEEEEIQEEEEQEIDWTTWFLGLAAFVALFGLIPFWLYVYLTLKP